MFAAFSDGFKEMRAGIERRSVWIALAGEDITDQHRRTTLGPLWLLLNYLAFAWTFILIFSGRENAVNYAAYVAIGLFVWLFILEIVTTSITLFVREQGFIKGTSLPLSVYVLRLFMQSLIRSGFSLVGCILILTISGVGFSFQSVFALLGILILIFTTPAVIIVLAMAGAFFPDLQFIATNFMRLGMFLTPVFWFHDNAGGTREILTKWNPFAYFLEIVRSPILNDTIPTFAFTFCLLVSVGMWILALYLLGKNRKKVAFVL